MENAPVVIIGNKGMLRSFEQMAKDTLTRTLMNGAKVTLSVEMYSGFMGLFTD